MRHLLKHKRRYAPGALTAALIADYRRESLVIDPRLKLEVTNPAEQIRLNHNAPHARTMRNMAERLEAGDLVATTARRVQRLPGAERIAWLADWRGGCIVTPGDSVVKAAPAAVVHL